jgi:two-component sensor histidine kinase
MREPPVFGEPAVAPIIHDVVPNLATAVVLASTSPLLLLDDDLTVLSASASFCRTFQIDASEAVGCKVFALGYGEWDVPQLRALLTGVVNGTASVLAYEMDLIRKGQPTHRLVLSPQMLFYGVAEDARLLLAIADVTDARSNERLKDHLLAEKAVLLRELQHRVANSLQIIASILLMSARGVHSDETKAHLQAAHGRVMSMAAVQQQLSKSDQKDVEVQTYMTQLCQSLGASMISDHGQVSIAVLAEPGFLPADVSVSLGLIITELVINSLKHAFPGGTGKVTVRFTRDAGDWTASVSDNGVGMPQPEQAKAGLGTTLINALAAQIEAQVVVGDNAPGVLVSIIHAEETSVTSGAKTSEQAV